MKRFISLIVLLLCLAIPAESGIIIHKLGAGAGATDYTQDANCVFAAYMNGDSTTETDLCNSDDLTQMGTVPRTATYPSGYSGYSRDFEYSDNGDGLYHADGGATDISSSDMTICAWGKIENDTSDDALLVNKYYGGTGYRQYAFKLDDADDAMEFMVSSGGSAFQKAQGNTSRASLGTDWHHHCAVYDGSYLTIYLDGSVDTNTADNLGCSNNQDNPCGYSGGIADGADPFTIGRYYQTASDEWDGLIDEVIVFNRALNGTEITEIYNNGIDGDKGAND